MDLSNKQTIQSLLQKNQMLAKKSYGQHFLVDKKVLENILSAADLNQPDRSRQVLEIGPGLGALTQELVKVVGKVIAVEADHEMVGLLRQNLGQPSNLTIIPSPIQTFRRDEYIEDLNYDLVANLPYSVSSYVLRDFLEQKPRPRQLIVMVQKEVAERVIAKAGESERSILSVAVELLSETAEIARIVSKKSFWPEPKVESAILKVKTKKDFDQNDQKIIRLAKFGFSQRRKKISNSLVAGLQMKLEEILAILETSGLDPNLRPQDLTINQWKTISQKI